jgi:hypothetical protein
VSEPTAAAHLDACDGRSVARKLLSAGTGAALLSLLFALCKIRRQAADMRD